MVNNISNKSVISMNAITVSYKKNCQRVAIMEDGIQKCTAYENKVLRKVYNKGNPENVRVINRKVAS